MPHGMNGASLIKQPAWRRLGAAAALLALLFASLAVALPHAPPLPRDRFESYALAPVPLPAAIDPAAAIEPPRV